MAKYKLQLFTANVGEDPPYIIMDTESGLSIPRDLNNRHYEQFLKDVKEQGLDIVEGPEVSTGPHYADLRRENYPSIGDQLDKIYHQGLDAWRGDIKMVKDEYPKTMVGFTTTGIVPGWVQTEVDKLP